MYHIMILSAFTLGGIIYLINYFIVEKKKIEKEPFVLAISMVFASVACFGFNYLVHPFLHNDAYSFLFLLQMGTAFAYYYTLVFFVLIASAACYFLKLDARTHLNILAPSIIAFGSISKIGCIFAGCCSGVEINGFVFPVAWVEYSVLFIAFFVFQFFIRRNRMLNYILFYSAFRFIIEFFRFGTGAVNLFGIFTPVHWLAAAVLFIILINYSFFAKKTDRN